MQPSGRFSWWTETRSANPTPTCRKGGCSALAAEGSEWCDEHDVAVKVNQAWAESERGKLRRDRLPRIRQRIQPGKVVG